MDQKTIPVWISPTIGRDYERRGVIPELRPGQPAHYKTRPGHVAYNAPYRLAIKVLDDALEEASYSRGVSGRGIRRAYVCLAKSVEGILKREKAIGDRTAYSYAAYGRDPDLSGYNRMISCLFQRIGIPSPPESI